MKRSRRAQTVLGDRHDPVCAILLQVPSAACGTRPRELSNGWIRKRIRDGSEKRSSENLIRQHRQRTDLPPGSNKFRIVYESAAGRISWRSNMLRLAYADSGSACKLAGVQIIPLPTLANQILARTFFRSVALQLACPAAGKFSRASSAGGRRLL